MADFGSPSDFNAGNATAFTSIENDLQAFFKRNLFGANVAEAQQYFFDLWSCKVLSLQWWYDETKDGKPDVDKRSVFSDNGGVEVIGGVPKNVSLMESFADKMDLNHRAVKLGSAFVSKFVMYLIKFAAYHNMKTDGDLFWVSTLPIIGTAHYMAYYIPVDIECKNIILAIKAVLEEMKNLPISSSYNPDLPLEFRFVRASSSHFAPNYSNDPSELFMAVELPTLSANIELNENELLKEKSAHIKTLNGDFRRFMCAIEKKWALISDRAKPHYAKVYGFEENENGSISIFSPKSTSAILTAETKQKIQAKIERESSEIFSNSWIKKLLE